MAAPINPAVPDSLSRDDVINGQYRIDNAMQAGAWGQIYQGVDLKTGVAVAIKVERADVKRSLLAQEAELHEFLSGGVGVPTFLYQGAYEERPALVMEMLGQSLHELVESRGGKFSMKTVLMLADQAIARLEFVHAKGFIHRDIKPQNFLIGLENKCHQLNIIDFGFAKRYWDPKAAQHAPYREDQAFVGTPAFASLRAHLGIAQSRRDDLEALGYMLVYLLRGSLPWYVPNEASLHSEGIRCLDTTLDQKMSTPLGTLCKDLPAEMHTYFKYCRDLKFEQKPDYKFLRGLFRDCFSSRGYVRDYTFDWMLPNSTELYSIASPRQHSGQKQASGDTTLLVSARTETCDSLPTLS